jgi:hypothetical protein
VDGRRKEDETEEEEKLRGKVYKIRGKLKEN